MKKWIFVMITAGLMLMAGLCPAQPAGDGPNSYNLPPGKWWRLPEASEKHGITPTEQEKLDELYMDSRRKMIDLKGILEKEMLDLELLMDTNTFDEKAAMEKYRAVQNARSDLSVERFRYFIEVRKLLGNDRYQLLKQRYQEIRRSRRQGPPARGKVDAKARLQ